jgi:hypothetical protein
MWMDAVESKSMRHQLSRRPWLSVWSLVLGIVVSGAMVIGGSVTTGLITFGLFVAFAAVFYFGRRNETIAGLSAPGRDERWEMINQRALGFAGTIMILILVGGWIIELANGNDGSPYSEVIGGGAIAYFGAALWLRSRS